LVELDWNPVAAGATKRASAMTALVTPVNAGARALALNNIRI
jgi:hypothetical protein